MKPFLVFLVAMLFATPGHAATILATGTYDADEAVSIDVVPDTLFGSGTYRFRFQSSTPLINLIGNAITLETVVECIDGIPCLTYTYERRFFDIAEDAPFSFLVDVRPTRTETFAPDTDGNPGAAFIYTEQCCAFSLFQSGVTAGAAGTWVISAVAVPEPSTWVVMIVGFLALGCALRHRSSLQGQGKSAIARKSFEAK